MGCANSKEYESMIKTSELVKVKHDEIGLLKVKVQQIKEVTKFENFFQRNSIFLQLNFMNQNFLTTLISDEFDKQVLYPRKSQFQFVVNRLDTSKCLQLKLFAQQHLMKKKRLLKTAESKEVVKQNLFMPQSQNQPEQLSYNMCLTSQNDLKVGWARVSVQFKPMRYQILTMRVDSVTLRNQPTRKRKIYVNIKIGGQQFQSQSFIESQTSTPIWQNAIASFIIPQFLSFGKLSIYQKDQYKDVDYLVGELKFDLRVILESDELQSFSETISLKDKTTGSVNLQFLKTKDKVFQIYKIQRPKRIKYEEQVEQQQADDKKQNNDNQNQNYVPKKKQSNATTVCSLQRSINIISSERLIRKLSQLRENCYVQRQGQQKTIMEESYRQEKVEWNELDIDRNGRQEEQIDYKDILQQNVRPARIFSDPELSFHCIDIPQTSSIIIQQSHSPSTLNRPQSTSSQQQQSRISSTSTERKTKQSSLKLSCISNKSKQCNIVNNMIRQKLALDNNSPKQIINQKQQEKVRFDSFSSQLLSKLCGGKENSQNRKSALNKNEKYGNFNINLKQKSKKTCSKRINLQRISNKSVISNLKLVMNQKKYLINSQYQPPSLPKRPSQRIFD